MAARVGIDVEEQDSTVVNVDIFVIDQQNVVWRGEERERKVGFNFAIFFHHFRSEHGGEICRVLPKKERQSNMLV